MKTRSRALNRRDGYPTLTGVGVTSLSGFQFEIKVVVRLPTTT